MFTFNKKKKSNPYKDGINSFDSAVNMVEKVAQTGGFFFKKEASFHILWWKSWMDAHG